MSILPITPETHSKMKYIIIRKFEDDPELRDKILAKLAPFWKFRVCADFRDVKTGQMIDIHTGNELLLNEEKVRSIAGELGDFERTWPWQEKTLDDCIEVARYRARGLKNRIKERSLRSGYVRVMIQKSNDPESKYWDTLESEEFSVNIFPPI